MMRISEAEDAQADACVEWINSFDGISHTINHIQDLSDGIVLFEVLSNIDSKWFKLIRSADVGDNWVLKINNLKKLYKLVSRYYEEVLGLDFHKTPDVNLNAIAKDSDLRETLKLCKLVLCIAVLCSDNERYIQKIQSMPKESQQILMIFIDEIIKNTGGGQEEEDPHLAGDNYTPRSSYADDGTYKSQSELARISKDKEELEVQNRQLIDKHSQLLNKYDRLEAEKQELQARLKDMDTAVAQASETGRSDFIMRTEIEHLKQDLQRSEDSRQEQERKLEDQHNELLDLGRKNGDLLRSAELAARLKDQLDEYRHTAEKLQKAENVIDKYKKKLEETADLRKQIKALEDQNHTLMDRNQQIEDEYRKVLAFKTLMDSYKDQVAMLETKNNELIREKNKLEYELTQSTKKVEVLELDRVRDSDRIQYLEDNLQEVQLGMGIVDPNINRAHESNVDDMDIDPDNLNDSLEDSLKESNVTELKMSKRRLERQLKTLQEENAAGRNQKAVVLQHLLDDANRLKTQFEKNYIEVSQERDILQSDMARIREGIPDALVSQNEHTLSLRLRNLEIEKELKALRELTAKLEKKIALGQFAEEGEDAKSRFEQLEGKSKHLENQAQQHLEDINKLLLEKDLLQRQSIEQKDMLLENEKMNSEMKASLAAFEAKDEETIKQHSIQLQHQIFQLQERLASSKLKYKKAQEFIKKQDDLVKGNHNAGDEDEQEVSTLKSKYDSKEEENEKLKKQLHEVRIQSRREQQLIISAWYDVSRRSHKEILNSKSSYPTSWLGQQRRTLDNQLKRR